MRAVQHIAPGLAPAPDGYTTGHLACRHHNEQKRPPPIIWVRALRHQLRLACGPLVRPQLHTLLSQARGQGWHATSPTAACGALNKPLLLRRPAPIKNPHTVVTCTTSSVDVWSDSGKRRPSEQRQMHLSRPAKLVLPPHSSPSHKSAIRRGADVGWLCSALLVQMGRPGCGPLRPKLADMSPPRVPSQTATEYWKGVTSEHSAKRSTGPTG
jgi:hypothetical protein